MSTQRRIDVQTLALLSKSTTETMERLEHQDRMQTNATLTVTETIRAEATEVIKVIQHTTVQRRARSLSMHSQIEPDGFTSSTTRVRRCLLSDHIINRIIRWLSTHTPLLSPSLSYLLTLHYPMIKSRCASKNTPRPSNLTLQPSSSSRSMARR